MQITIEGVEYSTHTRLNTFEQLHLARKLGPALPTVELMSNPRNVGKDKTLLTVLMLSNLSDSDSDFVVKKALSVVSRKQTTSQGAPVWSKIQAVDGSLMFDDIKLSTVLTLAVDVIEENLGDFFRGALGDLETQAK